jgi:hypothetical protein
VTRIASTPRAIQAGMRGSLYGEDDETMAVEALGPTAAG